MGSLISAKCRICDFKTTFKYGGSRWNYLHNCPVPAINIKTGEFENVNYKSEENNATYKFYSNEELKGDNEDCNTLNNFDLQLNTINNYCPKCEKYKLDFDITIYTD